MVSKASMRPDRSAVEYEPAGVIAQALIVEHEIADFGRKLLALPLAFHTPGSLARRRLHCPDCISRGAQFMGRDMGDRYSLGCRIGRKAGGASDVTGGGSRR
jgi:hypothetical protein